MYKYNERERTRVLTETKSLLSDLKRCGSFYYTAIKLDIYDKDAIGGEELENRIDTLLTDIDSTIND